jgi:hypothetical protein
MLSDAVGSNAEYLQSLTSSGSESFLLHAQRCCRQQRGVSAMVAMVSNDPLSPFSRHAV